MIMTHRSESKVGMESMAGMPAVAIPTGGTASFTPGGYHLMCMQPKK